jgi:quinol monooxygenase YgiN
MIAAVRGNEPGCVLYRPTRSPSDPDAFLLYEEYLDQQALDAHRRTAVPLGGLRALSIHLS